MTITPTPTIVRTIPVVQDVQISRPAALKIKTYSPSNSRNRGQRTDCLAGHPLTQENIYVTGNKRRCKVCQLERVREHRARQK